MSSRVLSRRAAADQTARVRRPLARATAMGVGKSHPSSILALGSAMSERPQERRIRPATASDCSAAEERPPLRVAGLFAGVGGIELGLHRAGHEAALLCELD